MPAPRRQRTPLPDDFGISDNVRTWAKEKGFGKLEARLEHFKDACKANGYKYINWDAAFRNAIRGDWAKLGHDKGQSLKQRQVEADAARKQEMQEIDEERMSPTEVSKFLAELKGKPFPEIIETNEDERRAMLRKQAEGKGM